MKTWTREQAIEEIDERSKHLEQSLSEWAARFAKDPGYALSWSDDSFKAAAQLTEGYRLKNILIRDDIEDIMAAAGKHLRGEILRGASYPKHSTSLPSNLMDQYTLAAQAELYDRFYGRD
jgi:hypothetical protein